MKTFSACVASAIVLFIAGAQEATAVTKNLVFRVFTDVVDPAEQQPFETAIKAYNRCLADQKFTGSMRAYGAETGDTYKYTFVFGVKDWAALDRMRDVVQACDTEWRLSGNRHLKSETSLILSEIPEFSYIPEMKALQPLEVKPALVDVTSFVLKNSAGEGTFLDGISQLRESATKSTWPGNFILYKVVGASSSAPEYVIISSYKGWTEYGSGGRRQAMTMLESVNGKDKADAVRKAISDTVVKTISHVDSYIANLSYVPPKN